MERYMQRGRFFLLSEIQNALVHMGAFKAPGEDGLKLVFYQFQWQTVGKSMCKLENSLVRDPSRIKSLNRTLIALIPKVEPMCSIKHLRLISL